MRQYHYLFFLSIIALFSCETGNVETDRFADFIESAGNTFDLLIMDGRVINGIDTSSTRADVLIEGEEIVFVGEVDSSRITVTTTIDAGGKVVAPGFIDAHAHGDPLSTPAFDNFLRMGVTTICLGQDGTSPERTDLGNWMTEVDRMQTGVNIAMFVGHGTIRQMSGIGYREEPAAADLAKMLDLLKAGLEAGCFGLSTGLEYTPGIYAQEKELEALARVVGEYDGLIMSHVRNEDNDALIESIQELLHQGRFCKVHVSHLKAVYGKGRQRAEEILATIDTVPNVTADFYPYNASYTGIGIVFPTWAKAPNDYQQVKRNKKAELLEFLKERIQLRNGPGATLFGTGPNAGKTLQEVSTEKGQSHEQILLDIGPRGASGAYFVMDSTLQERLFQSPKVMVCSDGSPTMYHPRGYGTFAKIIEEYVLKKKLVSLPVAIHKMTGLTARTLSLADRGSIASGKKADILIFDPAAIKANATYTHPKTYATGFEWVIINGKIAIENGKLSDDRYGRVLRKQ